MKARKCKVCKVDYVPFNSLDKVCGVSCAIEFVMINREKDEIRKAKAWRKEKLKRKRALKTKGDWLKEAQTAFNAFIRERDKDENCISCSRQPRKRNAGHYRSVGAHPEVRFHPFNCHLQCEHCNTYKSGNQIAYRAALIGRIGESSLDWLEGPHESQHWSIEDIQEIKAYYREQLRILVKERE